MKMKLYLQNISVTGPGFSSWEELQYILDNQKIELQKTVIPAPEYLPQMERRRVTKTIKLALAVAMSAYENSSIQNGIASVFATSHGDTEIMDYISRTLQKPNRPISPTKFHNSLHNAPSGYWSIAQASHKPEQALIASKNTFTLGLLDAAMYSIVENQPVLLVSYDIAPPDILKQYIKINYDFAVAFILTPNQTSKSQAELKISLTEQKSESITSNSKLNEIIKDNIIAKCLPLLESINNNSTSSIYLDYNFGHSLKLNLHKLP